MNTAQEILSKYIGEHNKLYSQVFWIQLNETERKMFVSAMEDYARQFTEGESKGMQEEKCVSGCKTFTGGEKKHHKDCFFYPYSMSQKLDELLSNPAPSTKEATPEAVRHLEEVINLCEGGFFNQYDWAKLEDAQQFLSQQKTEKGKETI